MSSNDTLMWEARAAEGRIDELVEWLDNEAVPYLREQADCRGVHVYRSEQDEEQRAVVLAHFDGEPARLPDPPEGLLHRDPHQWPFQRVRTVGM
ncbi:hypothetical protein FHX42_001888 [Saccharopolyspora lacisalsi]|uniref:Uncharacterized protein n=1 Tax=Halosaccharopolyspora lacisalsi TaxID=1000566 RepID=A0A839DZ96_9PSEU|nr:hypothetical protein [Halosaccharopolyspora lacisalsi]MBA8824541.1 hypothetical protein [Halosaccharopolyspora lacisalsi]